MKLKLFLLCFVILSTSAMKKEDIVEKIPGLSYKPVYNLFSGYLSGSSDNIQLHYVFVEAQQDPTTKPLVLWMNGGPGCSSMEGFLTENGPFTVLKNEQLRPNNQSWNQIANVLYLEAPAGVGYSYAKDRNVTTDDDFTSLNNLGAIKSFLTKFPEYQGRDFYITGESYAGVYVPTLALRVLETKDLRLNLKGIAVGNGLTNYELNDNSLIYFAHYHGLFGNGLWTQLLTNCCNDPTKIMCLFTRNTSDLCQSLVSSINNIISTGLDVYNLYSECAGGVNTLWDKWAMLNNGTYGLYHDISRKKFSHTDLGNLFRTNRYVRIKRERTKLMSLSGSNDVKLAIPCVDDRDISNYMNSKSFRRQFHIIKGSPEWQVCSDSVNFNYIRKYQDLSEQYKKIVKSGIRTYLYNGDVDMACNYLGDEWFVDSLGFTLNDKRRSWLYMAADKTKQIGGFVKGFLDPLNATATSLTYLTIRGSGHMAPTDRPRSTYRMYESFIKHEIL